MLVLRKYGVQEGLHSLIMTVSSYYYYDCRYRLSKDITSWRSPPESHCLDVCRRERTYGSKTSPTSLHCTGNDLSPVSVIIYRYI